MASVLRVGLLAPARCFDEAFAVDSVSLFEACGANLGNFAFIEALWRHLPQKSNVVGLPWSIGRDEAREKCDILIVAAANQLGAHTDLGTLAKHWEHIGLPMIVVGLGAQAVNMSEPVSLSAGTERWVRTLAALRPTSAPNIGVRGEFTRQRLGDLGLDSVVIGCPSLFLNPRADFYTLLKTRYDKQRIDRLVVAAGSRHFAATGEIERQFVKLVTDSGGAYVVQADLDMVRLARGEAPSSTKEMEAIRQFLAPQWNQALFLRWWQRHAMIFKDATSWLEALRNFDFAIGTRFHGVMLAIQAGVPGGVVAHDSRTMEMCQTMNIPMRCPQNMPKTLQFEDIYTLFPWNIHDFCTKREQLRRVYVKFWRDCGIEPHKSLTILQAAPPL